jgi:hypothetical protein
MLSSHCIFQVQQSYHHSAGQDKYGLHVNVALAVIFADPGVGLEPNPHTLGVKKLFGVLHHLLLGIFGTDRFLYLERSG